MNSKPGRYNSQMQRQTSRVKVGVTVVGLLLVASIGSTSAQAGTINLTYSDTGALTAPPVFTPPSSLSLNALAIGSIFSGNPALDSIWNPVVFSTQDVLDVITGFDNGTFSLLFADGSTLSGNLSEVDSAELLATNLGSFTQIFTFTGGTGEFLGASGSLSGSGIVGPDTFTGSGSGTLTAAGISTPEPASAALIFSGLVVMVARRKLVRRRR